jgi:ABC-type bacteriocin/lantibiotic exporter with double-glycine peptidase domain
MLDDRLQEALDAKRPKKNLIYALAALGFSILASLIAFFAMDSFIPRSGRSLLWVTVCVYFAVTAVSGIFAFLACRNAVKSLKTNSDVRNYIALVLGGLLLLGIARQIWLHLPL